MALEWQVFCPDTIDKTPDKGWFGGGGAPGTQTYPDWLISAGGPAVMVAALSLVVALVVGYLIGITRTLPDSPWLTRIGNWWVGLFRNIPLLVQIFLWYHVMPVLFPAFAGLPKLVLVVMGLGLFT